MRESEVNASGVNVESFAEIFHSHGGTFDVPPGAPWADACLPEMLAGFGGFPEREIAGVVFFVAIIIDASAGFHSAEIDLGEFAVLWKFGDAVIDGTFAWV